VPAWNYRHSDDFYDFPQDEQDKKSGFNSEREKKRFFIS